MQLTVLDPDTLKITLSPEEAAHYLPDVEALDRGTTADPTDPVRASLRALLEEAGRRAGFDLISRRILVRIYPTALGGCELYVSFCEDAPSEEAEEVEEPDTVCKTDSPRSALMLRIALSRLGFAGKTELWLGAGNTACFLRVRGKHPPILGEFGAVLSASGEKIAPWLREHCRLLPEE